MKVLIGTNNPGKVEGAKLAFECYYNNVEFIPVKVNSEVSDQPVNEEIYKGAKNRVNNLIKYAKENNINADFFAAIESGITNLLGKWCIINIAVISDNLGYESFGTSSSFPVPDKYVDEIITTDLGKVMDRIFSTDDIRYSVGGISYLTHGKLSRIDLTKEAFLMSLTEYINDNWNDKK